MFWIFLSTCKINIEELNFKRPIATTEWHCVQTSDYPLPAVAEVSRLISNCTLNERLPHQPLPQLQFCFTSRGWKEFSISLSSFNVTQICFILDSFLSTHQCRNLQIRIDITNNVVFGTKVDMFQLILMPSSSRFQIRVCANNWKLAIS
jgi:hypothetical protein